jgi:hypothetical protein
VRHNRKLHVSEPRTAKRAEGERKAIAGAQKIVAI